MSKWNMMSGELIMRIMIMMSRVDKDTLKVKREMSDEIAEQIRTYLSNGGKIKVIPKGEQTFDPKVVKYNRSIFDKGE